MQFLDNTDSAVAGPSDLAPSLTGLGNMDHNKKRKATAGESDSLPSKKSKTQKIRIMTRASRKAKAAKSTEFVEQSGK